MTEVEQRRKRQQGVDVVAANNLWNHEAQLPQAVFELSIIKTESLPEHARVGVFIQDDEINVSPRFLRGRPPTRWRNWGRQLPHQLALPKAPSGGNLIRDDVES